MSKLTSRYLEALQQGVLIFDGAMGTSLQLLNLSSADFGGDATWGCNDFLVISKPDAVAGVHRDAVSSGLRPGDAPPGEMLIGQRAYPRGRQPRSV